MNSVSFVVAIVMSCFTLAIGFVIGMYGADFFGKKMWVRITALRIEVERLTFDNQNLNDGNGVLKAWVENLKKDNSRLQGAVIWVAERLRTRHMRKDTDNELADQTMERAGLAQDEEET